MSHKSNPGRFGDVGLPGDVRFVNLLYNRRSETLVAVISRELRPGFSINRLFLRPVGESAYVPISVDDSTDTHEDASCCEDAPFLIFNVLRVRPFGWDHSVPAAGWIGVCRFNLETKVNEMVLDKSNLRPSPPYASGWVSHIISVRPDGSGAVCSVGLKRRESDERQVMDYFVYEVSFIHGLVRQIARLPAVFL
jgi:hypothetical protein